MKDILKALNQHEDIAWETWPSWLKRSLKAISANGNGLANSCTFGPSREYFFRKHGANGSSVFVKG